MLGLDEFRFEHIERDTEELVVSKLFAKSALVDDYYSENVHGNCVLFHCRDGSLTDQMIHFICE